MSSVMPAVSTMSTPKRQPKRDRSYTYNPPKPTRAQRLAALHHLRWHIGYAAAKKREDTFSEFEWVRNDLPAFSQMRSHAVGAVLFAHGVGLISKARREQLLARIDRIGDAKPKHPPRKGLL